jgi:phosphoenolpyruvate synthase/pyruvate phosphate dikinase
VGIGTVSTPVKDLEEEKTRKKHNKMMKWWGIFSLSVNFSIVDLLFKAIKAKFFI